LWEDIATKTNFCEEKKIEPITTVEELEEVKKE
jgi:hypothetical protein